jgi:hypothetical protein
MGGDTEVEDPAALVSQHEEVWFPQIRNCLIK